MRKLIGLFVFLAFIGIQICFSQTREVTGTVIDKHDKSPLPGVSVVVKGNPSTGVATDVSGKFALKVSDGDVLVFSFIGMKPQEVAVNGQTNIRVELELANKALDEVMVVAYGTAKKSSFTGAASVVKANEISTQKESLVKSLQGRVAGVRVGGSTGDPGSDQDILIRGISSISASSQPLYVVDGVAITNDNMTSGLKSQSVISSINPDDIESLTVLKDAAAASLYGSRAANGVIIITTKQGKEGKTKLTYNMETGWTNMAVGSQYNVMNAAQIQQYYSDGIKNYAEINPAYANLLSEYYFGHSMSDATTFGKEYSSLFFWNPGSEIDTDWKKEVYGTGMITDHQISISGGSSKTHFYSGFGYNKTKGLVRNSEFERYSGRINVDHEASDWLKISVRQMVSFTTTKGFRDQNDQSQGLGTSSPLSILYSMDPTAENILEDGSYNPNASFSSKISNPNLMLGQATGPNAETVSSDMMRSMTNFEASVTMPYNFSAKTILGYDYMENKDHEFWAPSSVNGEALGGLGYRYSTTSKTLTSSTTLNYDNSFGRHNINALAGYEVEERNLLAISLSTKSYSTDKLPELVNGQPYGASSATYSAAIQSVLGNVNYNFDNRYYLAASFRRDGSSRLGKDNRWANFWSISSAWRIGHEAFLSDAKWLNDLKFRVSYGTNGNLPAAYYANLATYSFGGGYGDESAIYWANAGNSKLGWEKCESFNVGIDFAFLNKVNLSVEYYNKMTKDLLFEVPTSIITGFSTNWQNLGKIKNDGIEVTLTSNNIRTGEFSWTTNLNLTKQNIKIKKLPGGNDVMYGDGNMYILREGESIHSFYLPQWLGVNPENGLGEFYIDPSTGSRDAVINGQIVKDGNVTNYYTQAGQKIVGKGVPDWMGSMTNSFIYKNFDLSFMISFQTGASLFDYPGYFLTYSDGVRMGNFNVSAEVAGNYWRQPGDRVEYPKPIYSNPYRSDRWSSRTIKSTDNIRMREITVGYKIPVSKRYINNLRVFFKSSNPFLIYCATDNIDPDVNINGYRTTDTPQIKSFMFGLNFEL